MPPRPYTAPGDAVPTAPVAPVIRVALIDDHVLMRTALVGLVNNLGGYHVVHEAENGAEFTQHLKADHGIHLAIIDLNMPVMDGYATIAWLHQHRPEIKPVALTLDDSETAALRSIRCGARSVLLKSMGPLKFKEALDHVRDTGYGPTGTTPLRSTARGTLHHHYARARAEILAGLSPKDIALIKLACAPEEYTYEEIGARLGIKASTVETHRKKIFERFGLRSKAGLVIFAYRWGIVQAGLA